MENSKNVTVFTSESFGEVRTILNDDGSISINAEDTARNFGWIQIKNNKIYVKWERMNVNSYRNTAVKMFETGRKVIIEWQPDRELELMIKGANTIKV